MSQRDMIFVERITDGEFCDHQCPLLDVNEDIYSRCSAYCNHFGCELGTRIADDAPYRCDDCLVTPSVEYITSSNDFISALKSQLCEASAAAHCHHITVQDLTEQLQAEEHNNRILQARIAQLEDAIEGYYE